MTRFLTVFMLVIGIFYATTSTASEHGEEPDTARILAIGDSLMAWHSVAGRAIPDIISEELNEPTSNRSLGGARLIFKVPFLGGAGLQISNQVIEGDWDWVVMNGGGNDLWFGCGCSACDQKMDKLITEDGEQGEIPRLVNALTETGAKVLYFGYLRSPGVDSMIEECRDEGDELEQRISDFAHESKDVYFMSNADLVPDGDLSYHALDRIHPSQKASAEIGKRVVALIRKHDPKR